MKQTPTKESHDPNRGNPVSALKRRPPAGGDLGASPSKKHRKRNKMDRRTRRVSFAPDPELTMIHHFEKDELSADSDGRHVLSVLDEQEDVPAAEPAAAYQPGFMGKTVPDHSPVHGGSMDMPLDSPGMVSMEITQPVLAAAQLVHGSNGGALAMEDEAAHLQQEPHQSCWGGQVLGEVTAGLPSFGALVEEDAYGEGEQLLQEDGGGADTWGTAAAVTMNITHNITGGIPGLSSLIAEDEEGDAAGQAGMPEEEATAGMDLTVAEGRVLEHAAQPGAGQPQQQQEEEEPQQLGEPEPAAEPADKVSPPAKRRNSTSNLTRQREVQVNKWGFAPGREDTLDINLELHGRMFMSDTTFNRMYADNTTSETTLGQPVGGPRLADMEGEEEFSPPRGQQQQQQAVAAEQEHVEDDLLLSPELSPLQPERERGQGPVAGQQSVQPNWQAPAFLPPYAQKSQHTITSDHPALIQSPADTNSTMNTMETRRLSVGAGPGDTRRLSINSRRMSLQDATGRLLQDDFDDDLGLDLQPAPQPTAAARQPEVEEAVAKAAGAGPDATERLLVDDDPQDDTDQDGSGPLADMKRQLRMLSQEAVHEEQAAEEPPAQRAARTPTPPRPAHSFGVADSSNPVTMALLRSGGTTRLLQDTVHVKPGQQVQQPQAAAVTVPARASAAGGGTTKLLADMTMVSMVGAKLRGQHTGPLGQRRLSEDAENRLTDYSLDEFEAPPELPLGLQDHRQQQQQHEEAQALQSEPAHVVQHGGRSQQAVAEAGSMPGAQQQVQQQLDETPPPASTSQGYPLDFHEQVAAIPGGPKIHRTPVPVRPSASQRTQGTPHSVRSMRSLPQNTTPASRQQAATPISAAHLTTSAAAAYPVPQDDTMGIIGGPKLMRTPVGGRSAQTQPLQELRVGLAKTPLTGRLPHLSAAPGSAMAQHYPGTGQHPTSAVLARYPGSAVAAHRLGARGTTPLQQQPLPMTFQDFTKLMDVQFLDNLRRGASINYADMQRNPVPKTVQEAYTLLCSVSPQVAVLENGIRILQELVQERRIKSAELETFIGLHNPAVFGEVQFVDEERLEEMKTDVGLLKKLLRQKAVAELKAYRKEMEEDKAHRLMRNLDLLQQDRVFLEQNEQAMVEVAKAAQQHIAERQRRMQDEARAHQAEAERRERVTSMRASLQEQQESNAQRQQQLAEAQERVAGLQARNSMLGREREAIRSKIQVLQQRLSQTQDASALANQSSPQVLLDKSEQLDVLTACTGWRLERLQQGGDTAELALWLADLFSMQLRIGGGAAVGSVELAAGAGPHIPEDRRKLAADLLTASGLGQFSVSLAGAGTANLAAAVQAASARLGRIAELLKELDGLRLSCGSLSEVSCSQGAVRLAFVNLRAEVQFSVALRIPGSYPLGEMPHELKLRSDGGGHVTAEAVAAAVAAAPEGRGRIRAMCAALSDLAGSAAPAQPYFLQPADPASPEASPGVLLDADFHNYSNPLFGASASCSMAS